MEFVELIIEIVPLILSALATVVAFVKGKGTKATKTLEEITTKANEKYTAYVEKQCKKNNIENVSVETTKTEE